MKRVNNRAFSKRTVSYLGLLIVFFVFIISVFCIYGVLNSSLVKNKRISIVWHGSNYAALVININQNATLITLPSDVYVSVPHGYGSYRLDALWRLGELEGDPSNLFTMSMQSILGISVNGLLESTEDMTSNMGSLTDIKNFARNQAIKQIVSKNQQQSSLTFFDWVVVWYRLRSLDPSDYKTLSVSDSYVIQKKNVSDGLSQDVVDNEFLDSFISETIVSSYMRQSKARIALVNASGLSRVAYYSARMVSNMGGFVVRTDTSDDVVDTCVMVIAKNYKNSFEEEFLQETFPCELSYDETKLVREDILIIAGRDLASRFYKL